MAVVKMHQASDGSLHPTFEAYAAHERKVKIETAAKAAVFNASAFEADADGDMVLHTDNIYAFIADNAAVLEKILAGAVVSKRGRKGAAA